MIINNGNIVHLVRGLPLIQSVRYTLRHKRKEPFRKPVWQPIAPSKLYRIKQKEKLSEEETRQRQHLEYTYSVDMKSIREFLRMEFYQPTIGTERVTEYDETAELDEALRANDQENKEIGQRRQARTEKFQRDFEAQIMAQMIAQQEENRLEGERFDAIAKREIERSKTYITRENIEEKIEEALMNQTDYDYGIDIQGKVVFDGSLHPYAFRPKSIPETSSHSEEIHGAEAAMAGKPLYLKPRKLF